MLAAVGRYSFQFAFSLEVADPVTPGFLSYPTIDVNDLFCFSVIRRMRERIQDQKFGFTAKPFEASQFAWPPPFCPIPQRIFRRDAKFL
jgi:hypothetical protein